MRWPEQAGAASGVAWRASVLVRSIIAVVARDLDADAVCPRPSAVSDVPTHHQLSSSAAAEQRSSALCRARYGAVEPAKLLLVERGRDRGDPSILGAPRSTLAGSPCRSIASELYVPKRIRSDGFFMPAGLSFILSRRGGGDWRTVRRPYQR